VNRVSTALAETLPGKRFAAPETGRQSSHPTTTETDAETRPSMKSARHVRFLRCFGKISVRRKRVVMVAITANRSQY
jgi:hypothetical protein